MVRYVCACDCGRETTVRAGNLRTSTRSCGCSKSKGGHVSHRKSSTTTYNIWCGIIQRCTNKGNQAYSNYGARGITVCDQWKSFENFLADMGERPKGLTIERRDNSKGYEPGNCYWATRTEQNRNRRNSHKYDYRGESLTLPEISERTGIQRSTLFARIEIYGWDVEKAVSFPVRRRATKT